MNDASPTTTHASALVDRVLRHLWRWGLLMLASGWLIGVSMYAVVHYGQAEYMLENNLSAADRSVALRYGRFGIVAVIGLYLAVYLQRWRRDRSVRPPEVFANFSQVWFVSLTTPLVVALFIAHVERDASFLALLFITVITGFVMFAVHRQRPLRFPVNSGLLEPLPPWHKDPYFRLAALLSLLYAVAMTYLSLMEHWSLATHAYDLGIYDNIMWNTLQGEPLGCSICRGGNHSSGHFDPFLILLTPVYKLWPRAESLLVFQAWWVASAGLPLYLVARRALPEDRGFCVAVVATFFLHPALHGVNLFDFHSLVLSIPLALWSVHCVDAGSRWSFVLPFGLLLLVREDMPLLAAFISIYALLRRRPLLALFSLLAALTYLYVIKTNFMPDPGLLMQPGKDTSSHIYYYADMIPDPKEGMGGLVKNTFSNPIFVLKVIFLNEKKSFYIYGLLFPLLFLPLVARSKRVLMLYGLAFIGLATRKHVYSYHFQYSAVIFPFLMAAVPEATKRVSDWATKLGLVASPQHLRRTIKWGMLTATLLFSARFGAFVPNSSFLGGWNHLHRWMSAEQREHYARVRDMIDSIPDDAVVSATSTLVPHLSNRESIHLYPSLHEADYILVDAEGLNRKPDHKRRLERIKLKYMVEDAHDGVELLRRVAPRQGEPPSQEYLDYQEERRSSRARRNSKNSPSDKARPKARRPSREEEEDSDAGDGGGDLLGDELDHDEDSADDERDDPRAAKGRRDI